MGYARSLSTPIEEFDRDAEQNSEAQVVNVSPHVARFEIGQQPGSPPRRFKLRPGESQHLPSGYCHDFKGAGRGMVRATIESLTEFEVYRGGPSLPMVVHVSRAAEMRAMWAEALERAKLPPPPVDVMLPSASGGEPIKMTVQPAAPVSTVSPMHRAPIVEDDEAQDGTPLDEPPPDHNDPLPEAKPRGGKSGK